MRLRDLWAETWEALDANRGRSLLTVLGIVIGISAVIAMTALIGGVRQGLMGELGLDRARVITMGVYNGSQVRTAGCHFCAISARNIWSFAVAEVAPAYCG